MIRHSCEACGAEVAGEDLRAFGDAFIAHVRADHQDWPYPDTAVRNYAEATQRLTGPSERLDAIGEVEVHRVTEDRIDDFLGFFDHDVFVGNPAWAACYCTEPHLYPRQASPDSVEVRPWQQNRELAVQMLRAGTCFGYLAYVDGRPGAWVNASKRSDCALYRLGPDAEGDVPDEAVASVSCFAVAPPYRRHGLAARLLDAVLEDAPARGVAWIEAYPRADAADDDAGNFKGPRSLFDARGFEPVRAEGRSTVVRRRV